MAPFTQLGRPSKISDQPAADAANPLDGLVDQKSFSMYSSGNTSPMLAKDIMIYHRSYRYIMIYAGYIMDVDVDIL